MNDYIVSRRDDIGFLNNFSVMKTTDVVLYKEFNQFKVYGCKMNINFR